MCECCHYFHDLLEITDKIRITPSDDYLTSINALKSRREGERERGREEERERGREEERKRGREGEREGERERERECG
jgi:hypothetical protein